MPVLHRARHDASLTGNRFIAEIVDIVLILVYSDIALFDRILKVIQKLEVPFLENIVIWVLIHRWRKPNGVDSEEWTKSLFNIILLDI